MALALRRRRASGSFGQLWAARLRTVPGGAGPEEARVARRVGARRRWQSGADISMASWLAAGLRAWSRSRCPPRPSAVTVADTGAAVGFEDDPGGEVPLGWERRGPKVWTLDRDADVQYDGLSPLPGLVSIGRRADGSVAMVDLESVSGLVALEGEANQGRVQRHREVRIEGVLGQAGRLDQIVDTGPEETPFREQRRRGVQDAQVDLVGPLMPRHAMPPYSGARLLRLPDDGRGVLSRRVRVKTVTPVPPDGVARQAPADPP